MTLYDEDDYEPTEQKDQSKYSDFRVLPRNPTGIDTKQPLSPVDSTEILNLSALSFTETNSSMPIFSPWVVA